MILSIETSTSTCSVAITNEDTLISSYELHIDKSHSGSLTPMIDEVVKQAGIVMSDLTAIAISKGPGSYTGLRIGTATAKGLCFSLDIPLIGINTLEAMALDIKNYIFPLLNEKSVLIPMLDARRMEVYTAAFDKDLNKLMPVNAKIINENSFEDLAKEKRLVLFGNGSDKCKNTLNKMNFYYIDNVNPAAKAIGNLAFVKYEKKEFEDLAYYEPFYLKDFMVKKPTKNKSLV